MLHWRTLIVMRKFGNELIESMKQAAGHARGRTVRCFRVTQVVVTQGKADRGRGKPEKFDEADLAAVSEGLAQAERRQFSSNTEVKRAFRRFDR